MVIRVPCIYMKENTFRKNIYKQPVLFRLFTRRIFVRLAMCGFSTFLLSTIFIPYFTSALTFQTTGRVMEREIRHIKWNNPENRFQFYYIAKNCTMFSCGPGFACVRIGNGHEYFNVPVACEPFDRICFDGEVGVTYISKHTIIL